jgi:hypothetical protein
MPLAPTGLGGELPAAAATPLNSTAFPFTEIKCHNCICMFLPILIFFCQN